MDKIRRAERFRRSSKIEEGKSVLRAEEPTILLFP